MSERKMIYLDDAINALKAMALPLHQDPYCEDIWERDRTLDNAINVMRDLPPAQPMQTDKDFEKQIHAMFDHILDCKIEHPIFQDTVGELMKAVIQAHNNSAQPERKECEWIEIADDVFAPIVVCSRCSQTAIVSYGEYQRTRYCPYCGAEMKNGGDEKT
jgi:hypothetical protein